MIRNLNQTSAYDNNLDLFIQYFQNPLIRSGSKNQLERIARAYSERIRDNEITRTAVKSVLNNSSKKIRYRYHI